MRLPAATTFRSLKHPAYRKWAVADFVSVVGSWMQNLGLNWLVVTTTGSPGMLGLSLFFQAAPGLLLGSWAGAMADRLPVRRLLFVTQTLHLVLALVLAAVAWCQGPIAVIYGIAFASGLVLVFDGPALGRFGAQLVTKQDLSNALGLGSVTSSAGRVLGMSLAGVLVGITGESVLFVLNALSFVAVLVVIGLIRPESMYRLATSGPQRTGTVAGIRYVLGNRPLIVFFVLSFVLSCLGRNYQVTMATMSEGPLRAGVHGYSVLSVVFAVGTIAGGLVAAAYRELTLRLFLVMAVVTSLLQITGGLQLTVLGFAAVLLPIAAGSVLIDTAGSTRMQLDTDEDMRGRVLAAKSMVASASAAVGGPLLGWLSEWAGAGRALEIAGLITVLATGAVWMLFARMRERRVLPRDRRWAQLAQARLHPECTRSSTVGSGEEEAAAVAA